jgi:AraC-like DNA-binding protein
MALFLKKFSLEPLTSTFAETDLVIGKLALELEDVLEAALQLRRRHRLALSQVLVFVVGDRGARFGALRRVRLVREHVSGDRFVQQFRIDRHVRETLSSAVIAHVYYVYGYGSESLATLASSRQAFVRGVIATFNRT